MKRALILLLTVLLLVGCGAEPVVEEDGGTRDQTDSEAPKTIQSTQITDFRCAFSTLALAEETSLGNEVYHLEARLSDGAVKGSCEDYTLGKREFEAEASFMEQLQQIVFQYDLAQYNGISIYTSGLPDPYGADISITYESGEQIYASNNEECFLPIGAMEALHTLFSEQTAQN